jgi:hypothetical protein
MTTTKAYDEAKQMCGAGPPSQPSYSPSGRGRMGSFCSYRSVELPIDTKKPPMPPHTGGAKRLNIFTLILIAMPQLRQLEFS